MCTGTEYLCTSTVTHTNTLTHTVPPSNFVRLYKKTFETNVLISLSSKLVLFERRGLISKPVHRVQEKFGWVER
jgi:hypothetical protein